MKFKGRKARLAMGLASAALLTIGLSSCSGAVNEYGKIEKNKVYMSIGEGDNEYKITEGELWNELQWDAVNLLDEEITKIVLNEEVGFLNLAFSKSYNEFSSDEKKELDYALSRITFSKENIDYYKKHDKVKKSSDKEITEEDFDKLYSIYKKGLSGQVVKDVFNLDYQFDLKAYSDKLDKFEDSDINTRIDKYQDNMYLSYHRNTTKSNEYYGDVLKLATQYLIDKDYDLFQDTIMDIVEQEKEKYYIEYAKELSFYEMETEKAISEFVDDDDDDDEYGIFADSTYNSRFQKEYINTFDVNLLIIKFADESEFNDTMKAFGIKIYNGNYYFLKDNADDDYEAYIDGSDKMTYRNYSKYYSEFENAKLTRENGAIQIDDKTVLELYVQLYNYIYGGYREKLPTNYTNFPEEINNIRHFIYRLISDYASNANTYYNQTVDLLKEDYSEETQFDKEGLKEKFSDSYRSYVYSTLKLKDDNGYDSFDTRYSSTGRTETAGYVLTYKFADTFDEIIDEDVKKYEEYYKNDFSAADVMSYILLEENTPADSDGLFEHLTSLLISDQISDNTINDNLSDLKDDTTVKCYNEALEICYKKDHSDYSNTIGKADNRNILATIKYDGKTYNLNIYQDNKDKNAIKVPGSDTETIGAYNELERTSGITTAIDLIVKKIVKDTKTYKDTKNDKDEVDSYERYLNVILSQFANGGLESSGYPSSLGKYNFLMLYFHTADIDDIIYNHYVVQSAQAKLLTDYSSDTLAQFFKRYTDLAYDNYFSLSGKRLVVFFDGDDDSEPDDIDLEDTNNWIYQTVEFDIDDDDVLDNVTYEKVCKKLIYDVYNELSASNTSHSDLLSTIVEEINGSAKVIYKENLASPENKWAKYKKIGLNVKSEDVSATNSTTNIDFNLKQRLYDYARGFSLDEENNVVKNYQYFINDAVPSIYIEPLTIDSYTDSNNNDIISTKDGFNLILVTSGTSSASAEFKEEDDDYRLITDLVLNYNDNFVRISDVYNEEDKLNLNQIKLYTIDYTINGSSVLSPSKIADALKNFLSPVLTRYQNNDTQRIILLSFIKAKTNTTGEIYQALNFANEDYNGNDGYLANTIEIQKRQADSYSYLVEDKTNTSDLYPSWWDNLNDVIDEILSKDEGDK